MRDLNPGKRAKCIAYLGPGAKSQLICERLEFGDEPEVIIFRKRRDSSHKQGPEYNYLSRFVVFGNGLSYGPKILYQKRERDEFSADTKAEGILKANQC